MRPLKIALAHAFAWPEVRRGGERLVDELTEYLRKRGHVVDVYLGTLGESRFHHGREGRSYRMRIPWMRMLERYGLGRIEMFGVRALAPLMLHRYDVVHAFTPTAALASIAAGQRTVYTVLGHPTPETLPESRVQRTSLARAVTMSTRVAVLSRSSAEALEAAFSRRPVILPPGVSMARCEPSLKARRGAPRLLFSGDLGNPDKGLATILKAFDELLAKRPKARLGLSGPGSPDRAFREIGTTLERIEPSLDQLGPGFVDEVPQRYRDAHVTVLPSRHEAFGIVLVESLACGTPVIGGTPGGATDILGAEGIGKLVPFGDVPALVTALDECIKLASGAKTPARCRAAAESWDWQEIGPRYEALYAEAAGPRRVPGAALLGSRRARPESREALSAADPSS